VEPRCATGICALALLSTCVLGLVSPGKPSAGEVDSSRCSTRSQNSALLDDDLSMPSKGCRCLRCSAWPAWTRTRTWSRRGGQRRTVNEDIGGVTGYVPADDAPPESW